MDTDVIVVGAGLAGLVVAIIVLFIGAALATGRLSLANMAAGVGGVRANGGEIRVRNLPSKGCVFTVDLPRAAALAP